MFDIASEQLKGIIDIMFQQLRRVLFSKYMLALCLAILAIVACRCTPLADVHCMNQPQEQWPACITAFEQFCPEGIPNSMECQEAFSIAWYEGTLDEGFQQPLPSTPNPGSNNIVAPPNCSVFRLTSPLDGLPNGTATFYWDPMPNATGYQLNVYDGGTLLGSWTAGAGATNLTADISNGAIGGGFVLYVELKAFTNSVPCTSGATLSREAGSSNNGGSDNHDDNNDNGPAPEPTEYCPDSSCIS
jgi:hypothetical protein